MSVLLFNLEKPELEYYFHEMVQAFEPGIKNVLTGDWDTKLTQRTIGQKIEYRFEWQDGKTFKREYQVSDEKDLEDKGIYKGCLYDFLSEYHQKKLMWGSLTGIKPVKIVQKLDAAGFSEEAIAMRLEDYYRLSHDRTRLLLNLSKIQAPFIAAGRDKIGIYIGIPLCPSKCSYCSFISTTVDGKREDLSHYFTNLLLEMEAGAILPGQ